MATLNPPTDEQLRNYLVGNLPLAELDAVENSIESIPGLKERIAETAKNVDDTLLSALRKSPVRFDEQTIDPDYEHGLQQVCDIGREWSLGKNVQIGDEPTAVSALTQQFVDSKPVEESLLDSEAPLTTLRDYRLLEKVGQGGMGTVYKAVQMRLDKIVALKVLPQDRLKDRDALARFEREMRAVGRLDHPNIVRATDAGEQDGRHFLVMEFVDGIDLAQYVQKLGPLTVPQAMNVIRHAAAGLQYAHEQGLVHRDIKPSNLMVEGTASRAGKPDSNFSVKILDLGLARLESESSIESQTPEITTAGTVMGTVDYMSPEQALDTHKADARSDIYSLGCTLYFLLTGQTPYVGKTMMERLVAHREHPIPTLSDNPPSGTPHRPGTSAGRETLVTARAADAECSPGIAQLSPIFAKMVAKNPADRFQSMAEVAAALDALLQPPSETNIKQPAAADVRPSLSRRAKVGIWASSAAVMLTAVIWISTNKAKWKIETQGEGVEISNTDGKITARDTQTGTKIELTPDGASVAAQGNRNVVKITDDTFELIRDGKIIASGVKKKGFMTRGAPSMELRTTEYALLFDGRDDYIEVPSLKGVPQGPMTVEAWVTLHPKCPRLGTVFNGNAFKLRALMDGPQWMFLAYGKNKKVELLATPFIVLNGQRIHVAGVYGDGTIRLYVNGTLVTGAKIQDGFEFSDHHANVPALIGVAARNNPDGNFRGLIHSLRISSTDRYKLNFRPELNLTKDGETRALYRFDSFNGSTMLDDSGNRHHGNISGASWVKKVGKDSYVLFSRTPVEARKPVR